MASNTENRRPPTHHPRPVRDCDPTGTSLDPGYWQFHASPEPGPMTAAWGCCPAPRHPGELLTRSDVCHVHADRAAAERCGVLLGGARPSWSGLTRSGPRFTAWRGRCRAPRAAGYVAAPQSRQPCCRRAVSSAARAGTGRTRRPPPAGATVPPPNRRLKRGSSAPGLQM